MTVSSTTLARVQYNGNSSTTIFAVPFVFSTSADLKVYLTNTTTGVETLQTLTTHYTVSGGGGSGTPATGSITFVSAPATGNRVTILRSLANTQGVDYVENDAFPAQSHELALDRATLQIQDLKENLTRAIVFTPGSNSTNINVGTPVAGDLLVWDETATILESLDPTTVAAPILPGGTGIPVITVDSPREYAARAITGTSNQISVVNGDGVSGNPTLSLSSTLVAPGTLEVTSTTQLDDNTVLRTAKALRFNNSANTFYTAIMGGNAAGNVTYTLPIADGTNGYVLKTNGSGVLSWTAASVPLTITGTSNQITVTGGTGDTPTISIPSTLAVPGTLEVTSTTQLDDDTTVRTGKSVKFNNAGNTHFTAIKGGNAGSDVTYTLPTADGTSGQAIITDGSGNLSFTTISSGGGATTSVSQSSHGFAVGDILYLNSTTYTKAKADAVGTAEVVGIVSAVADANTFTLSMAGRVTGLSGLTAGTVYFLSGSSAGALTATEPTTSGYVSKPLLVADTTTSGIFINMRGTVIGAGGIAAQSDMETGTSITTTVTPGRMQYHPGVAKAWCMTDMAGASTVGYNISSVTDTGTGQATFNFTTSFSSANFVVVASSKATASNRPATTSTQTTSSVLVNVYNDATTLTDPTALHIVAYGDQ